MRYVESANQPWLSGDAVRGWGRWFCRHAAAVGLGFVVPMALGAVILLVGELRGAADAYGEGYLEGCSVVAYQPLCADAARLYDLQRPRGWAAVLGAKTRVAAEIDAICRRVTLLTGSGDDLSRTAARIATRYQCPTKATR